MSVFCSQQLMIYYALDMFGVVFCFLNTDNSVYYTQIFNHPWLNFQSTLSSLVHLIACFRLGFEQEIVPRQHEKFGELLMEAGLGIIDCWYFHTVHIFISGWLGLWDSVLSHVVWKRFIPIRMNMVGKSKVTLTALHIMFLIWSAYLVAFKT